MNFAAEAGLRIIDYYDYTARNCTTVWTITDTGKAGRFEDGHSR
jgi:hypothetical protein